MLADVVGGVEAEAGVLQHLAGPPHQLDKGHPRRPKHHHVRDTLTHPGLQPPVVGHHTPEKKEDGRAMRKGGRGQEVEKQEEDDKEAVKKTQQRGGSEGGKEKNDQVGMLSCEEGRR